MQKITKVQEEVNAANNIKLATFRALRLKCFVMRTVTTGNTGRRLVWSYSIFSGNKRCTAFISHQFKRPTMTLTSNSDVLLVTNSKQLIIHLNFFRTTVLHYSSVKKLSSSSPGIRNSRNRLIAAGLNHAEETDVGLLCLNVLWWCRQKKITTLCNLQRHWMLQGTVFKGDLVFRHHDVSIIWLALL
jgi:hypothetical protein